ncbi:MAG: phosphoribosylformylglycinamidine cyclo-ligase [Polyangia bacterium]|jgi:phosphoribosylformylglycinamidine cyclo-ligase|nr:phosphoribosylformylglycinamidine cyclo-ligase [Polyangia bacterium]
MPDQEKRNPLTYKEAGVDIDAGNEVVERIKGIVGSTRTEGVISDLGGFGGLFALPAGMKEPVLVSGTDGVGTKLKVAFATGVHGTVGIDLVAMCVNDILTCGATPLFFLDYFATGALAPTQAQEVIGGIAEGCRQAGCALLGGETAELPGFYPDGEYDLAGFAVGVVERSEIISGRDIRPGDRALGLASSGLHSNGYSLARKALLEVQGLALTDRPSVLGSRTLAEELLTPTRIYAATVKSLRSEVKLKGLAHITGGGLLENPPRILPSGLGFVLDTGAWPEPPIFGLIAQAGVEKDEMRRTFNLGIGMLLVVSPADVGRTRELAEACGETVYEIGEVLETPSIQPGVTFR